MSRDSYLILFIALPFIGFYLGIKYQKAITIPETNASFLNWKTFKDKMISFKYPLSWNNPTSELLSTEYLYLFSSNMSVTEGFTYDQTLGRQLTYNEELKNEELVASNSKQVYLDGVQAMEYTEKVGYGRIVYDSLTVLLPYKNYTIRISMPLRYSQNQQTFDQILSTFKFIN